MPTRPVLRFKVQFLAKKVKVRPLKTRVCVRRYMEQREVITWVSGLDLDTRALYAVVLCGWQFVAWLLGIGIRPLLLM